MMALGVHNRTRQEFKAYASIPCYHWKEFRVSDLLNLCLRCFLSDGIGGSSVVCKEVFSWE